MPRILSLLIGALVMTSFALDHAFAEPQVVRLKNGFTVLIAKDDRFPLVSARLYVHAGSAFEKAEEAGVSHFLEHLVFKGTKKRPLGQIARDVESAGGYLNAMTSFDYTMYLTDLPARDWKLGLDVLKDQAFDAALDPTELEKERAVVLAELDRGMDEPGARLFKEVQALAFAGSSLARPVIGFRETVEKIDAKVVRGYIGRWYQPQSMLLVVCGNINPDEVLAEAQRLFGELKNDVDLVPPAELPIPSPAFTGPQVRIEAGKWNKVYLNLAFPIPGHRFLRSQAAEVLAHVLGGDKTSRFYKKFKYELNLVDEISVSDLTLERGGLLYVYAVLDPDKLERFYAACLDELARLESLVFTDEEIDRAKLNMEDSLHQSKETLAGLASKLGYFQFFEGGLHAEKNYLDALKLIDKPDLKRAAAEYVRPERLASVVLVPESADQAQAAKLKAALESLVAAKFPDKRGASVAKTDAPATTALGPEVVDLGKNRSLILIPDKTLPYTAVNLVYRGGDALLTPDKQGLAELTGRILPRGAGDRDAQQIIDRMADRAARIGSDAGREVFTLEAKFPSRFSAEVLDQFIEIIEKPRFSDGETEKEKANLIAQIRKREDQPTGLAFRHIFPFLFRNHSYSYFHDGDPAALAGYTAAQAKDFWERQRRAPFALAVCGDFDRELILKTARRIAAVADAPTPDKAGPSAPEPRYTTPEWGADPLKTLNLPGRNQSHLFTIFQAPPITDPDAPALTLLRAALSGQSGILFSRLRDGQSLGYAVSAFLWQSPAAGFMAFYIGADPKNTEQALAGFRAAAESLGTTPISDADLARAKNVVEGEYYRDRQSLSGRSGEAALLAVQGMPLDFNRIQLDRIAKLDAAAVMDVARRRLGWKDSRLLTVVP